MTITAQIIPTLPAAVEDGLGVDLTLSNGVLSANLDYRDIPEADVTPDSTNYRVAVQNIATGEFTTVPASAAVDPTYGRTFFFLGEHQSNGLMGITPSTYAWPPNLYIWGWDGLVNDDTYVGTGFFQPTSSTITHPDYIAVAEIAKRLPNSKIYLASFAKGAQYISQWRLTYPAANGPPVGGPITAGGPVVGGGYVDAFNIPYWNMRQVRDNNMPVALAAAGVTQIDGYFMIQGENEALQGTDTLAVAQFNSEHHATLRGYSWFPYTTPFIRSAISPYESTFAPQNKLLQLWTMRDNCRQYVDTSMLPSSMWKDAFYHFDGLGSEYAGRLWAEGWLARPANRTKGRRTATPVGFSNVSAVVPGLSVYDFDAEVYEDGGSFFLTPSFAGTTIVDIPFVSKLPVSAGAFSGVGLAIDNVTGARATAVIFYQSATTIRATFSAAAANQHTLVWSGRGLLAS